MPSDLTVSPLDHLSIEFIHLVQMSRLRTSLDFRSNDSFHGPQQYVICIKSLHYLPEEKSVEGEGKIYRFIFAMNFIRRVYEKKDFAIRIVCRRNLNQDPK